MSHQWHEEVLRGEPNERRHWFPENGPDCVQVDGSAHVDVQETHQDDDAVDEHEVQGPSASVHLDRKIIFHL